jgi:hypothetical protein
MKNLKTSAGILIVLILTSVGTTVSAQKTYKQTTDIPVGITTPDIVETSIGTLKFIDGAPYPETSEMVYDFIDKMRGVDVFLKCIPAASVRQLMEGPKEIGQDKAHKVLIMEELSDSKPLYLTMNSSTLYTIPVLDLKTDGPTVLELPSGMLGAFHDAWFRYLGDAGPFGQDKGQGGKYLILPPAYEGAVPDGYFIIKSASFRVWILLRSSIKEGLKPAVKHVKDNLRLYPLSAVNNPPKTEFINGSHKSFNTIHTNDYSFYAHVDHIIQEEPLELIDVETRGLLASIGIEKGKEFAPDARMKRILTDAVAIGNAAVRSIIWYPRIEGSVDNMKGIEIYPGSNSAWIMGWVDKNVFFNGKDGRTMNSDARAMFHYPYTVVTPAMAVTYPGKGSDYGIAYVDADKMPFDGSKTYKLRVEPNPPVNDFWAVTIYDSQTRSMLQTDQEKPTVGSQTEGLRKNADGSYDLYFAPKAPEGFENNWVQTIPGKSWFTAFRLYGPLDAWISKAWRLNEIELQKQ